MCKLIKQINLQKMDMSLDYSRWACARLCVGGGGLFLRDLGKKTANPESLVTRNGLRFAAFHRFFPC